MKTHGPNSPQTIRGTLDRRKLRGLLDTRWQAEKDITTAPMVSPFGKGFHTLRSAAGTTYVVADQTGGRTFAKDTQVMLGIPDGGVKRAVIGGAVAGKMGGSSRTTSGRRRGTPAPTSNQYAFGESGGSLFALLYEDGTYVSERASITTPAESVCGIILTDPSLLVGDGSALLSDGGGGTSVKVWDVVGTTTYTYTCGAGWMLAAWPVYYDEAIYILEVEDGTAITGHLDSTMALQLVSTATDLTGAATVATLTLDAADYPHGTGGMFTHYHDNSFSFGGLMVDADGAVIYLYVQHHEGGHGIIHFQHYQFRVALAGGGETHRDYEDDTYHLVDLVTAGFAAGFIAHGGTEIYAKTDDSSTGATLLYSGFTGSAGSINAGPNGTTDQVYSLSVGVPTGIWRNGNLVTAVIEMFDGVNYPGQMFYFGED